MQTGTPELLAIGRFIQARRERTVATSYQELPNRRRHVLHLTQGELAELVGVSIAVISQIEQARYPNVNNGILHRISSTLQLSPQQDTYLLGLVVPRVTSNGNHHPVPAWLADSLPVILHPVMVVNPCYDILLHNDKALLLFGPFDHHLLENRNCVDAVFGESGLRVFFDPWLEYAASLVSGLRMSFALYPDFRDEIEVVAERVQADDEIFRHLWAQPDPLVKPTIEKVFNHPSLGELQIFQILTELVEAKWLTRVEFIPANDETAIKMNGS